MFLLRKAYIAAVCEQATYCISVLSSQFLNKVDKDEINIEEIDRRKLAYYEFVDKYSHFPTTSSIFPNVRRTKKHRRFVDEIYLS
uniref:ATP-binding protein n=1 Tax=Romanomermis culicivorax TaxID=13658 RepID=A0A915JK87_ROMCU